MAPQCVNIGVPAIVRVQMRRRLGTEIIRNEQRLTSAGIRCLRTSDAVRWSSELF
jgi:hypothetical protein